MGLCACLSGRRSVRSRAAGGAEALDRVRALDEAPPAETKGTCAELGIASTRRLSLAPGISIVRHFLWVRWVFWVGRGSGRILRLGCDLRAYRRLLRFLPRLRKVGAVGIAGSRSECLGGPRVPAHPFRGHEREQGALGLRYTVQAFGGSGAKANRLALALTLPWQGGPRPPGGHPLPHER